MTITDIYAEIRSLCDADSTSYPDAVILRRVNASYEHRVGQIIGLDGTWQFDDSNYTTLPIGTQDLVASQQDYSFDTRFLAIERVQVKDANGIWQMVDPIDKSQLLDIALDEYQKTPGIPNEYDKNGESIFLYPSPSASYVTLSGGLKVFFQRTASVFTSGEVSTGTKTPGFASPFHILLAYDASIPYCMSYKKDRVALFEKKAMELEKDLLNFYARREKDVRKQLTMKPIAFR